MSGQINIDSCFQPTEKIREAWKNHPGNEKRLSLEDAQPRNVPRITEQFAIKSSHLFYSSALACYWRYLEARGLYREMILLLQNPIAPVEAGSFTPEYLQDFCNYMAFINKGLPHVGCNGSLVKDIEGKEMKCIGQWRSASCYRLFASAVTKVLELSGHKSRPFSYPGEHGNSSSINQGNTMQQPRFKDFLKHLKHMLGKEHLT